MDSSQTSPFDKAMARYQSGVEVSELIPDFEEITSTAPTQSAGWTCLAWLQLLSDNHSEALRCARIAVKLNAQDPQARINLSLALLETGAKGVREHIEFVKRAVLLLPELRTELESSIEDGLKRKPEWSTLNKIKKWLEF